MSIIKDINLNNWSGEIVDIEHNDGQFEFYGYNFSVSEFNEVHRGAGYRKLNGSAWDQSLGTIFVDSDDIEEAVRKAVAFIANNV